MNLPISFITWRFYTILIFILIIVAALICRVVDLAVIEQHFLREQGDVRAQHIISTPAFRGIIVDRNGFPLAISTSIYSIWLDPQEIKLDTNTIKKLSSLIAMKPSSIQKIINKNQSKQFIYLKRNISPEIADQVKKLNIHGMYLEENFKRFYPEGEVAAHIIGFTNIDDKGQEGLEMQYNDWLSGVSGKKLVIKDRLGQTISEIKSIREPKPGKNLILSIDRRIQYLAYRELMTGLQKNSAHSGSVVVLDVKTGEVLAMANLPSYNPNSRPPQNDLLRNRAVTDIFEPGSTMKAFSVAVALDSGKFSPDTVIDTTPGWIQVGKHVIHDEHRKGPMSVTQILQYSSNVGVTKMMLTLSPERLWSMLHGLGFGEETGIGFPGERSGLLAKRRTWPPLALATLAFGYGISVTALQLSHAYATLANNGKIIPLSLLKVDQPPTGKRVMSQKLAKQMLILLESVFAKGGTGEVAKIPGYHVAGKSGTTKKLGENGYEKHKHISSFIGIAPVTNPRVVVAVVIHEPEGKEYLGGLVAGPVFKNIMEGTLRILNIPPDDVKIDVIAKNE